MDVDKRTKTKSGITITFNIGSSHLEAIYSPLRPPVHFSPPNENPIYEPNAKGYKKSATDLHTFNLQSNRCKQPHPIFKSARDPAEIHGLKIIATLLHYKNITMYDESYTALCSAATLQSNKNGFFAQFAQNITNSVNENWLTKFKTLTNAKRISKCLTDPKIKDFVTGTLKNVQEVFRGKSERLAEQKKREAELLYNGGKFDKSLLMYTQSVIRATSTDTSALWSRSSVFLELKKYQFCLDDVKLCLQQKLPEELKLEAYWKMMKCYENLDMVDQARITGSIILNLMKSDKYGGERLWKEKVESKMKGLSRRTKNGCSTNNEDKPHTMENSHPLFECASEKLHLSEDETAGKFFSAKEQINTGDTLVIEDPYVSCLLPEKYGSHCHHCLRRLETALPCTDCSAVAFCSLGCRTNALKSYHKYECRYLDLLIGSGMSILCFAALRIVTQQNLRCFTNTENGKIEKNKIRNPYKHVNDLVHHETKRNGVDFLHRTLMALFLLAVLKKSGYFVNSNDMENYSPQELLIAEILLRNLEVLQFNAHEIFEPVEFQDKGSLKALNIGIGLYKTASYFNHDCYPAISRYFVGTKLYVKAVRPISKGLSVGDNYGLVFTKHDRIERQRKLWSRYWFKCECLACSQNWPAIDQLDPKNFMLRCMKCDNSTMFVENDENSQACKNCLSPLTSIFDSVKILIEEIKSTMENKMESDEELNKFGELQDCLTRKLAPPHSIFIQIQTKLVQFWMHKGIVYHI